MCVTKLELETLEQGIFLEVIYALGFVVISFVINRLGKFVILCKDVRFLKVLIDKLQL